MIESEQRLDAEFDRVSIAPLQGLLREFIPQVIAIHNPLPREQQELRSRIIGMLLESIQCGQRRDESIWHAVRCTAR